MTLGQVFWLLMIVIAIGWVGFGYFDAPNRRYYGMGIPVFILFFILGWKVFGFVIQDGDTRTHEVRVNMIRQEGVMRC